MMIHEYLAQRKAEAVRRQKEAADELAVFAEIEQVLAGLDSQRGETAMKGSSSQQAASHQGSASAPDGLRADQLAKLPWRTNKRGQWAFADDAAFKELAAKIGTGPNNSFTDEQGYVHTITVGENGKKFINRSKSK